MRWAISLSSTPARADDAYLLDHPAGYMVPRADALVLGGSFEEGMTDARTDPDTCARILDDNRRFFRPGWR